MKKVILTSLAAVLVAATALAQVPTLTPTSPVVTNTTWRIFRDEVPQIYQGPGTGPNGYGDLSWTLTNFNESIWGWAAPVSVPNCLTPWGQTPIAGTTPIWGPRQGCSVAGNGNNDVTYFRRTFNMVKTSGCTYRIFIKADNQSVLYVNGVYVGSTLDYNWGTGTTFDITNFVATGLNVIAIQAVDFGVTGWLSAKVTATCAAITIVPGSPSNCSLQIGCQQFDGGDVSMAPNEGSESEPLYSCCRYRFSVAGVDTSAYKFDWKIYCCDQNYTNCLQIFTTTAKTFERDFINNYLGYLRNYKVCVKLTPIDGSAPLPEICQKFTYNQPYCTLLLTP